MKYMPVKCIDICRSKVTHVEFDKTNPINSFKVFWKSLQNARVLPNPVSIYSPDGESKIQDLPDEIKEKICCAVKTQTFRGNNVWERRLFDLRVDIDMWRKQVGLITLFVVILGILIQ